MYKVWFNLIVPLKLLNLSAHAQSAKKQVDFLKNKNFFKNLEKGQVHQDSQT